MAGGRSEKDTFENNNTPRKHTERTSIELNTGTNNVDANINVNDSSKKKKKW